MFELKLQIHNWIKLFDSKVLIVLTDNLQQRNKIKISQSILFAQPSNQCPDSIASHTQNQTNGEKRGHLTKYVPSDNVNISMLKEICLHVVNLERGDFSTQLHNLSVWSITYPPHIKKSHVLIVFKDSLITKLINARLWCCRSTSAWLVDNCSLSWRAYQALRQRTKNSRLENFI